MNDPGDTLHAAHETALPVVVNVINDLADGGAVTCGRRAADDTLYQNSWTNGYFNWYGGGWTGAGDWRHYFFNVDEEYFDDDINIAPIPTWPKPNLLVHTFWDGGYPTDINTWVLGPTEDCASNGVGPCAWYASAGSDSPGRRRLVPTPCSRSAPASRSWPARPIRSRPAPAVRMTGCWCRWSKPACTSSLCTTCSSLAIRSKSSWAPISAR